MHNAEQKWAHFYSKWCIVGYEIGALWDLWDCFINLIKKNTWIKLFMQNDCTVVLKIFTADRISVFPEVVTHNFDIWCVTVTLVHSGHAPNHPHGHPRLIYWKQYYFFQTFELLNVSNASSHICGYGNNRKRLLRCVKKEKGSKIHLYFAMWHNRAQCSQLSIFVHSYRVTG